MNTAHEAFCHKFKLVSLTTRRPSYIHSSLEGTTCYPAYFHVGERGWFLSENGDDGIPHRIHTSKVEAVSSSYIIDDDGLPYGTRVVVRTENTQYVFESEDGV